MLDDDDDFSVERDRAGEIGVSEGYVDILAPGFGLCNPENGSAISPIEFDTDVNGISIGPESDCDAVWVVSRSFRGGRMLVTTKCPWMGKVRGPFQVKPFYKNLAGEIVANAEGAYDGTYVAQVIFWKKRPPFLPATIRPPKRYEFHGIQSIPNFWESVAFAIPAFGRKLIKIQLVTEGTFSNAIQLSLGIGSHVLSQFPGGVNGGLTSVLITALGDLQNWQPVPIGNTDNPNQLMYEAVLQLDQVQYYPPTATAPSDSPLVSLPRLQRLDVPFVFLDGQDPGVLGGAVVDLILTVLDE